MNDTKALWQWPATRLAEAYRTGETTPLAVMQALQARIEAVNPRVHALVAPRAGALDDARASTERFARGQPLSALDGIALSVKDNLLTADQPTTWGCPALREHVPAHDELPVARARAAGAVLVGKTNVPEFTLEGYTHNRLFGTTRNPWNLALTPGGSSGGAAAGVAAGLFPLALGTDGGGSIRRPAAHCGLVGFKPSIGAVARKHALPSLLLDFEVVGPIARTVADARLLFDTVRGPDAADRRSWAAQALRGAPAPGRPLRVLQVPAFDGAPLDPAIRASCATAAAPLRQLGHEVIEGSLPLDLGFMTASWPIVGQMGLAWMYSRHPDWREGSSPRYLEMAAQGAGFDAARLWELLEAVEQFRRDCAVLFGQVDLVMTPATAAQPWPADEAYPPVIDGQAVGPRGHAVFTGWVNAAGLPAIALPAAPAPDGLPIGIQLVAAYGADDLLFDVAAGYEALAPWAWRWPALA